MSVFRARRWCENQAEGGGGVGDESAGKTLVSAALYYLAESADEQMAETMAQRAVRDLFCGRRLVAL